MIWDRTTRVLHWVIAAAILLNLFLLEEGEDPHQWAGYAAVGAVALRFGWGFFGGYHSRFSSWPLSPRSWKKFFANFLSRQPVFEGHNPLAAFVYILMWALILALGVSGWMMGLDAYWGEEWLENLHANFANGMQVLLVLHGLGLLVDSIKRRKHVWLAMVTGRK